MTDLNWRKATASNPSGCCLEATASTGGVTVRHSKDPSGHQLHFSAEQWEFLLTQTRQSGPAPFTTREHIPVSDGVAAHYALTSPNNPGTVLWFTPSEVAAFIKGATAREFDLAPNGLFASDQAPAGA